MEDSTKYSLPAVWSPLEYAISTGSDPETEDN